MSAGAAVRATVSWRALPTGRTYLGLVEYGDRTRTVGGTLPTVTSSPREEDPRSTPGTRGERTRVRSATRGDGAGAVNDPAADSPTSQETAAGSLLRSLYTEPAMTVVRIADHQAWAWVQRHSAELMTAGFGRCQLRTVNASTITH